MRARIGAVHDRLAIGIEENVVVVIDANRNPARRRPLLGALPCLHEGAAITRQVVHALCRAYEQAVDAIQSHALPDPLEPYSIFCRLECGFADRVQLVECGVPCSQLSSPPWKILPNDGMIRPGFRRPYAQSPATRPPTLLRPTAHPRHRPASGRQLQGHGVIQEITSVHEITGFPLSRERRVAEGAARSAIR